MATVLLTRPKRMARVKAWFGLPRRDYLILPAIFALTPLLLLGLAEAVLYNPFYEQLGDSCIVTDPAVGHKAKPNCVSQYKVADSPWIENRYNDCGYRTDQSCGPKPAGTIRAAVIGSSISKGYMVGYRDVFATRAAADLTRACGRPVEFQDLGGIGYQWGRLYARMQEALSLKPDLLVMTVTPYDLMEGAAGDPEPAERPDGFVAAVRNEVRERFKATAIWRALLYFKSLDPESYLRTYLHDVDNSGYLLDPLAPSWQERISRLNRLLGEMAEAARAANVPFVLVYVPPRPQVLLLDGAVSVPGTAPTQLEDKIGKQAARAGIDYIDMTGTFHAIKDVDNAYFTLSDHPTSLGHKLIADQLVSHLLSARLPTFAGCAMAKS